MQSIYGGHGDAEPDRGDFQRMVRRRQRPENEVPASVAIDAVLARTEDLVVFMSGARVFSNGVDLTLEVRLRQVDASGRHVLGAAVHGHGPGSGDRLLFGVEFADGRRASTLGRDLRPPTEDTEDEPRLWPGGGGGGSRSMQLQLFLSPLPPPGDFTVVCAWPDRDLPETTTVLSADQLLEAASRVRVLWPWEPEQQFGRPEPPPRLPRGSWFRRSD